MHRRRVLVVEDDKATQTAIADAVRDAGHEPVCASSAEDALSIVLHEGADLALVDRYLPGACGASLVRWLRGSAVPSARWLPVIGISVAPRSERDLVAAGAACFVQKPLDAMRLRRVLKWVADVYWADEDPSSDTNGTPPLRA